MVNSLVPIVRQDEYLVKNLAAELKAAEVFVKSGLLPKAIDTPAKVLVISEYARALQIPRIQAFASISVINGKPTQEAQLMRALIFRSYPDAVFNVLENTSKTCRIEMGRPKGKTQVFEFSMEDAKTAKLDQKDVWKKYPKALLLARTTAIGARVLFADVLMGIIYSPEELGAEVRVEGGEISVVDAGEVTRLDEEPKTPIDTPKDIDEPIDAEAVDVPSEEPEDTVISEGQQKQLDRFVKSHITSQKEKEGIKSLDPKTDKNKATTFLTHFFRKEAVFKFWEGKQVAILMLKADNEGLTKKELMVSVKEEATEKFSELSTNELLTQTGTKVHQDNSGKWVAEESGAK